MHVTKKLHKLVFRLNFMIKIFENIINYSTERLFFIDFLAQNGRPCVFNGQKVENGVLLRTSCKQDCQCLDGSVSCVMKCYDEHNPPSPEECPNARLQPVEDRCCDRWVCDTRMGPRPFESSSHVGVFGSRDTSKPLMSDVEALLTNKAYTDVVYEWDGGADGDELEDYQMSYSSSLERSEDNVISWEETNNFPGEGKTPKF